MNLVRNPWVIAVPPVMAILFVVTWWVAGGLQHAQSDETSFSGVLVTHLIVDLAWACLFVWVVWLACREDPPPIEDTPTTEDTA